MIEIPRRCEALLSSPTATLFAHFRTLVLLVSILGYDVFWMVTHAADLDGKPSSRSLLWLFDAATIAVEAVQTLVKYGGTPRGILVQKWLVSSV